MNETDNDGKHALILAAQEGHTACVSLLLDCSSFVDYRSHDGKTALRVAAIEGHKDVVHLLLCHNADVNYQDADGRSTVYILALENRLTCADFLLENDADPELTDIEGRTPLHVAAWQGHVDMVELLLSYCADVNAVDNECRTALQSAAWQGHADVCKLLLDAGAYVDHMCNQGATALCIAAQEGHADVVRILLQAGADAYHVDQFGRNPVRVALKNTHTDVVKILEEYGADVNGLTKHKSLVSVTSSSGDTKPSSVMVTSITNLPHATGSVSTSSESPYSTFDDKQKSFISEPSSKSSNVTTSSSGRRRGPEAFTCSFMQQIQQCTLPRNQNRPLSMLTPVDEPESPTSLPPSPLSDSSSPLMPNGPPIQIITNPMMNEELLNTAGLQIFRHYNPMPKDVADIHQNRKTSLPQLLKDRIVNLTAAMAEGKAKRNGITTNPKIVTYKSSSQDGKIFEFSTDNSHHVTDKQSVTTQVEAHTGKPQRPNGLALKKETPL